MDGTRVAASESTCRAHAISSDWQRSADCAALAATTARSALSSAAPSCTCRVAVSRLPRSCSWKSLTAAAVADALAWTRRCQRGLQGTGGQGQHCRDAGAGAQHWAIAAPCSGSWAWEQQSHSSMCARFVKLMAQRKGGIPGKQGTSSQGAKDPNDSAASPAGGRLHAPARRCSRR